jgi:acetyl-CoA carboxylase biotin carboxylase subunit
MLHPAEESKLLEESPSAAINGDIRRAMMGNFRPAALAVGYRGAATIEFLLDGDKNFYFMEMNTRLQVEHPVTEMVSGVDLVKWQIRIASGLALSFVQEDVALKGSAIECRINAENPACNFRPSCGKITLLHVPGGPWVRFDTALYQDYFVPPYYDSLIGKLIVHAPTREEAIRKMRSALCELVIEGVDHSGELSMEILSDGRFIRGETYTDFMETKEGSYAP